MIPWLLNHQSYQQLSCFLFSLSLSPPAHHVDLWSFLVSIPPCIFDSLDMV